MILFHQDRIIIKLFKVFTTNTYIPISIFILYYMFPMYIFLGVSFILFTYIISELFHSKDDKSKECENVDDGGDEEHEKVKVNNEEEEDDTDEEAEDDEEEDDEDDESSDEEEEESEEEENGGVKVVHINNENRNDEAYNEEVIVELMEDMIQRNNKMILERMNQANEEFIQQNMTVIIERQRNIQSIIDKLANDFNKYILVNIPPSAQEVLTSHIQPVDMDVVITLTPPVPVENETNQVTGVTEVPEVPAATEIEPID